MDWLRKAGEFNPGIARRNLYWSYLAAALAIVGRGAEAAETCAAALQLTPRISGSKLLAEAGSENPVYLAQRESLYEALRKAGMPE